MKMQDCIQRITDAAGGKLSPEQVDNFQQRIKQRYRYLVDQSGATDGADVMLRAAREVADEAKAAAIIEKRNAAINAARAAERKAFLDRIDDKAMGISMLNVGRNVVAEGGRLSVDARQKAWKTKFTGSLKAALTRDGVLELVTRGGRAVDLLTGDAYRRNPLDVEIARELWEIGREGGQPGVTGIEAAQKIAAIIHTHQEAARNAQNRVGAWIRKMPGYIVTQSHDETKIRWAAGRDVPKDDIRHFQAWRNFILPRLDAKATFGDLDAAGMNDMLEQVYAGLASGLHHKPDITGDDWLKGFKGSSNVARKLSQERVLHFASGEAWHEYHVRFSDGGLLEHVVRGLERAGDAIGLMEVWGTNPRAAFDAELARLGWADRSKPSRTDKLRGELLQWEFKEVDGTTRVPGDISMARIASGLRALQSITKLGGATLSSFSDIPTLASELHFQGENLLQAHKEALANVVRGRRDGEEREIADLIGVGIDGILGSIGARFDAADAPWGWIAKAQRHYFQLNVLSWWTDANRTGAGLSIAHRLAQMADREWQAVDPELQRLLPQYGIAAAEWEMLRRHAIREADGRRFMTPDLVQQIPDGEIEAHAAAQLSAISARYEQRMERMGQRYATLIQRLEAFQTTADKLAAADVKATIAAYQEQAAAVSAIHDALVKMRDVERAIGRGEDIATRTNKALDTVRFRIGEMARLQRKINRKAGIQMERIRQAQPVGKGESGFEPAAKLVDEIDQLVEASARLPDQLERELAFARTGVRDDLEMRLRAYLVDRTHTAVIEPGARERALLNMGTQRGTVLGEALRMVTQFKSFSVAFTTKVLGREIYGRSSETKLSKALRAGGGAAALGLAHLILGTTIYGYYSQSAKEMAKGREPRDPTEVKTWVAAFIQGGGAGIYADFLFGEANRYGGTEIESLLGPTVGSAGSLIRLKNRAMEGEDVAANLFQFTKNHTPGLNLFYTRAALDYLILYDTQEALNPGYLRRMERQVKKENDQEFWLSPSQDRLRPFTED